MPAASRTTLLALAAVGGLGVGALAYMAADQLRGEPVTEAAVPTVEHAPADSGEGLVLEARSPDVPALPFADNPDPTLCGIPVQWSGQETAWLTGFYEGDLIQDEVLLYDSHLRLNIAASGPHGSEVEVLMYQPNPVLDFYLVDLPDQVPGWIPAPFLSFDPVEDA